MKTITQPAITGYRQLSYAEVALMNEIKAHGEQLGQLVAKLRAPEGLDQRWISIGASPRGGIGLDRCARADAWLHGQAFVTPDNVRAVVYPVLRHRLQLSYDAVADGVSADQGLQRLRDKVAIPA